MSLDEIDFWDLELFSSGDPHEVWSMLRREAPVWRHDRPGGEPFWCVSRHAGGRSVLASPDVFSSQVDGIVLRDKAALEAAPRGAAGMGIRPMIHTDPPRHALLRRLVADRFAPRALAALTHEMRAFTTRCLDEVSDRREVDFVEDIAHRIPAAVIFAMMGVPPSDWDRLSALEHMTIARDDPEFQREDDAMLTAAEAVSELFAYFAQMVQRGVSEQGTTLIDGLLVGRIDGEPLPWQQIAVEALQFLAGGLDTARAVASAGGMLPLIEHPEQLGVLQDDLGLLPSAIEEFVRWATPIMSPTRTVLTETTLGTQRLAPHDRVCVWLASCNRDEEEFADPFRFDVRRTPNHHLGFGYGEHFCLGAHLARLTLRVEFEQLLTRFRGFELVGPVARVRSNFVGGLKHLPIRVVPT